MSKLTSLLKSRFQTVAHGSKEKQKGASALEYVVLAAVIVIAVAVGAWALLGGDGKNAIKDKFNDIHTEMTKKPS